MNNKTRSGLNREIVLMLCNPSSLDNHIELRRLIDSTASIVDVPICEEVFKFFILHEVVGDRLLDVYKKCDSELGVFVRLVDLIYKDMYRGMSYILPKYHDVPDMINSLIYKAKRIPKVRSTDELLEELLRIL